MGNRQAGSTETQVVGSKMDIEHIAYEPGSRPHPQETYIETSQYAVGL